MVRFSLVVLFLFCHLAVAHDQDVKIINRVESYFNALDTLQSDFTQKNHDASIFKGTFYLKSPGKFRFHYEDPANYVVVSNGKTLLTYDYDMDNPTYIPLSSLPVSFLFDKPLQLRKRANILHVLERNDVISVKLSLKDESHPGQILLVFSKKPFELKAWYIYTPDAGLTEVSLLNPRRNIKLKNEKALFSLNISPF